MTPFKPWKVQPVSRPPVFSVMFMQSSIALVVAGLGLAFGLGLVQVQSLVAGAIIQIVPHTVLALRSFASSFGDRDAVRAIYRGMNEKFLLTVCAFALVFKFWLEVNPLLFFIGYGVLQVSVWFVTPFLFNRLRKQ